MEPQKRRQSPTAKITHMWGDWEYYYVHSRWECRGPTDRSAYDSLMDHNETCIQMGKVCVERIRD